MDNTITWDMPFLVRKWNGVVVWEWLKVSCLDPLQNGNKYAAAEDFKNSRADIIGYDASQANGYWPDGRRL